MSSILKALKKLEHEKTSRLPDSLHIDSDILRASDSSRGFSPFVTMLLLLLVFGGGAAVAYFFMNGAKAPLTASRLQPVITAKSILPPVPPPVVNSETLPAEIMVVPARREALGKQQQKTAVFDEVADHMTKKPTKAAAVSNNSEKPKEMTETIKKELPDIPTLRVNGIAFQSGSADNMAIVNGTPVSNGSIIDNATVEEIRKDRVLFQRNGEKFEIQLGQSNR